MVVSNISWLRDPTQLRVVFSSGVFAVRSGVVKLGEGVVDKEFDLQPHNE